MDEKGGMNYSEYVAILSGNTDLLDKERTHGQPKPIGSLYGFEIVVKTDTTVKEGLDFCENRFFVRGAGKLLYNYNNGRLAADPQTACRNFINAFDSIPRLIEKYTRDNADIEKEIPVLKQVVDETWKKEDELKQLKAELAALDRRILLSLKSVDAQEANTEGVTEIHPEPQVFPSVAQPAPSMPGDPIAPAPPELYIHRMPDCIAHAAERKPPVLHAMPKTISIKELMNAGKEKGMTDGISQPEDGTEKAQEKPKWRMKF